MSSTKTDLQKLLRNDAFPRSSKYEAAWVYANEMGPNALWLTESLCQVMELAPGMRVLDLGCGRAMSSIFLAKEFGANVWATDLWIKPTENWRRISKAGVADRVFPIHAEAHALPFAEEFFDAIVCADAYIYFGTDDTYLGRHLLKFVRPGGHLGVVVPGLVSDIGDRLPEHLEPFWDYKTCFSWHTPDWWRRHWERTKLVDVELADAMPDGWRHWLKWEEAKLLAQGKSPDAGETDIFRADGGRYMGLVRLVARRGGEEGGP